MDKQKTIAKEVSLSGVGLHTANKVKVTLKPAPVNSGVTFVRTDLPGRPLIKVCLDTVLSKSRSLRRTSIGNDGVQIHTIEHLMAALVGLGVDNLQIEINNNELPGLDGSSKEFLDLLTEAGLEEQEKEKNYFVLKEPLWAEDEEASLVAIPSLELKVSYTLNYNHPLLKAQFLEIKINTETFKNELACARTFCLETEAEELKGQGLGKGANYENTLVVGESGVVKNKLRYDDEFIRHKILDLLGDLSLLGSPLKCHLIALKSGHSLNLKLVHKISEQMRRYSLGGVGAGSFCPGDDEQLDIDGIMSILPHRQPFLFVDKIISLEKGKRAVGIKNVSINDYFFKGHFPGRPVMPGVLIIEAMAQVGGVMMLSLQEHRGKLAYFMAANNIKFRKTVIPGDQLVLEVEAGRVKSRTGQVHGKALVDGKVVAEADLMFALVER